ncbi:MAG TPA: hypothetical protein VM182_06905 [Terriglobia bacterium]|nr:hypothetical protein [Terriglobia bacterium]
MRKLILFILGSFLLAGTAIAQTSQDSWDNLKQVQPGQQIEVVEMNLTSLKGKFISHSAETITLRTDKGETMVERDNVMRVSVRGGKRGRNALIGLGIGAAGGVAAGLGLMERETGYAGAVAGTIVFVAAVGAGVGAAFPGSRTIYRAERLRKGEE